MDIDTIACMHPGVDGLLSLARENDVKFSFFVNMGRAISYSAIIRKLVSKSNKDNQVVKLSSVDKLGFGGVLKTLLFNSKVGLSHPQMLHKIVREGHDLGLHGGKNHGTWQHNARSWGKTKLKEEVEWGFNAMTQIGLPAPNLFCSPGFTTHPDLEVVLAELGFLALADDHLEGAKLISPSLRVKDFKRINTTMLGQPGAVGYVENSMASVLFPDDVAIKVKKSFMQGDAVLYDHPCLVGRHGLDRLSAIIKVWLGLGGQVVPLRNLIEK
ncbi:polysaccharide deacetylase family protein [Gilvimarinus polysaccharolyticus]|uniref:polysaccharide deacetylase family protein n=1 Tax=Gilvimarinus polysaccharolyticus TaxID=863921 RepID=UPI0018DE4438|nr:polysaccharide deacetylase family protein [Gilvimarinus polysaccharolyticus]